MVCSIHGYEGDFVEATAFCCTLGQGSGGYGGGYDYGGGHDEHGHEPSEPYSQKARVKGRKAGLKGHKQTGAQALPDSAAVPNGGLGGMASEQQVATGGPVVLQAAVNVGQQALAPAGAGVGAGGSSAVHGPGGGTGTAWPVAGGATTPQNNNNNMGGFAQRRTKKVLSLGSVQSATAVRSVAAVSVASTAAAVADITDDLTLAEADEGMPAAFWVPEVQPASVASFDASRAEALRQGLAQVHL